MQFGKRLPLTNLLTPPAQQRLVLSLRVMTAAVYQQNTLYHNTANRTKDGDTLARIPPPIVWSNALLLLQDYYPWDWTIHSVRSVLF